MMVMMVMMIMMIMMVRHDGLFYRCFWHAAPCGSRRHMLYLEVGCGFLLPCIFLISPLASAEAILGYAGSVA